MYIVYKKESFTEDDSTTVFTDYYRVSNYDKAVRVAASAVLNYVLENTFMYSHYGPDDLSYLLSENPDKVLAWLVNTGHDFFKSFNLDFQVWVTIEREVLEEAKTEDITLEEWLDLTKMVQRKFLGETHAEA